MEVSQTVNRRKVDIPVPIVQALKELGEKYKVERILLFGSRAKGTNWERSDIDLAVEGFGSRACHLDFMEDVERIRTLLMFDVVDLNSPLVGSWLREEIKKDGVVLYEKV